MTAVPDQPLTRSSEEKIKLSASYFNGLAISLFGIGGISVPVTLLVRPVRDGYLAMALVGVLVFCGLSYRIHLLAKRELDALD